MGLADMDSGVGSDHSGRWARIVRQHAWVLTLTAFMFVLVLVLWVHGAYPNQHAFSDAVRIVFTLAVIFCILSISRHLIDIDRRISELEEAQDRP
jgi:ABC-type transport system involved in cytochrome c biogenesis permease subunit